MENDLALIEQDPEVEAPSLHAVGITATEIAEATKQIGGFLRDKLHALEAEHHEMQDALSIAIQNGWETKALGRAAGRLGIQVTYYRKLLLAVDAGYTIVPNMPCDQFAIRTSRKKPLRQEQERTAPWRPGVRVPEEKEQTLEPGEGRYESPVQTVDLDETVGKSADGVRDLIRVRAWAEDWSPIEFPFAAARPVVMTATQAAMALKLFDRIGVVPQSVQDADPIILGQIVLRERRKADRVVSFLIAWHLDLRTL